MAITYPYWNNDEVISSEKLNSMVQAIINGDPLAVKVSNATKNDVNQIVSYLSSLHDSAKTNLNSATSTSNLDTAYNNMTALVSNKLGSYANDDTVDLYSTGIRASIITFLQAYDSMMSKDRLNNKNTDNTLNGRIDSEAQARSDADTNINNSLNAIKANGGGRNYLRDSDKSVSERGQDLGYISNEVLNSLAGKTITVSVDTEWSGFQHSDRNQNRLGFELTVTDSKGVVHYWGAWKWPTTPSGKERVSTTFTLPANVTFTVNNNGKNGYVDINGTGKVSHAKIEKGTVAHDWSPAPEDANNDIASVNDKADANTASISRITSEGGGTNLLKDTDKMTDTNYWGLRGGQSIRASYGGKRANETGVALSDYNAKCVDNNRYIDYVPQVSFEQGTDYTVSFWTTLVDTPILYLNANDNANHQHNNSQQNISLQANGRTYMGWKQVTATFKPSVATAYLTFAVSIAWVSSFKLEKGVVAHDWSLNPDDIQSQLDNLNTNKLSSADAKWDLVATNSKNTYKYYSGSLITFPNNSSITLKGDRIIPHINLPVYLTDNLWTTNLNNLATSGEYDNAFIPSANMATLTNRPTNPDTNAPLTGDCFYTAYYAYSGTTLRAFQKIYSCDYNYTFTRSYNGSSGSWSNWSCLTPYA